MNNKPLLVGGLLVVLVALGGLAYKVLGDDANDGAAAVVTASNDLAADGALPEPAPAKIVKFADLSPHEKWREERKEQALRKLARIKKVGQKIGDFYMVEENGEEVFYFGDLASGVGRYGQPLYATVKGRRTPMGERRELRAQQIPEGRIERIDGPLTSLPNVSGPKDLGKALQSAAPNSGNESEGKPSGGGRDVGGDG